MSKPKISALCITWNQPRELGELIECFRRQTYEPRELIILDDAGQYQNWPDGFVPMEWIGDGWTVELISIRRRFRSLGSKRNACAALADPDSEYFAVWDTDDIYLPWALEATVEALQRAPWAQARHILEWHRHPTEVVRQTSHPRHQPDHCAYHGAWAYRRESFEQIGYPIAGEEDNPLARRMHAAFGPSADSTGDCPWYIYSRGNAATHISSMYHALAAGGAKDIHTEAYRRRGEQRIQPVDSLEIGWRQDYDKLRIPPVSELKGRPW